MQRLLPLRGRGAAPITRRMVQTPQKRLYIKTYGCQMNVYDSERMADVLRPLGYALADEAEDADLVVLNTCHIREKAAEKVYSELGKIRLMKERQAEAGGTMTIAVAGCVAQAEGEEIIRRQPAVDLVVGPAGLSPPARADRARPPRVWRAAGRRLRRREKFDALPARARADGPRPRS